MNINRRVLALVVVLFASVAAHAVGPRATATFFIQDKTTYQQTPATAARLDQYVCFKIRANLTPDGDHALQLMIYDGLGRQVLLAKSTVTAQLQSWSHNVCFGFDPLRDAPGTWWYVVELDGNSLLSQSIEIRPAAK